LWIAQPREVSNIQLWWTLSLNFQLQFSLFSSVCLPLIDRDSAKRDGWLTQRAKVRILCKTRFHGCWPPLWRMMFGDDLHTDRFNLPEVLQACLEGLLAHHVVRLRFAFVPGHRYQRPRAHVMEILVGYGESLRQVRPSCRA